MSPLASPSNFHHYNRKLRKLANTMRKNMTKSEACMWKYLLKASAFHGYAFRRQRPILNYIVDFCCFELMLIIEVDGISHTTYEDYISDQKRDVELASVGFHTLRFSSFEVLHQMDVVSERIAQWVEKKTGRKFDIYEETD